MKMEVQIDRLEFRIDLLKDCLQGVCENACLRGISLLAYVFLLPIASGSPLCLGR